MVKTKQNLVLALKYLDHIRGFAGIVDGEAALRQHAFFVQTPLDGRGFDDLQRRSGAVHNGLKAIIKRLGVSVLLEIGRAHV